VDFPIKNGDFPIVILVYQRVQVLLEFPEIGLGTLGTLGTRGLSCGHRWKA